MLYLSIKTFILQAKLLQIQVCLVLNELIIYLKFPGWETTLYEVAAILRMLRDPRMLPVCSSVMINEYPVQTRLVCLEIRPHRKK